MSLIEREQRLYEDMWSVSAYADNSPGERLTDIFLDMASIRATRGVTVLDAGCGSGKGATSLAARGLSVSMFDITDAGLTEEAKALPFIQGCLWDPIQLGHRLGGKVDYAYCCDVLEHIPTEFTMLVISRLLDVSRYGIFLSISQVPDVYGVFVGEALHKTVKAFTWWRDNLNAVGSVKESRDLITQGLFFVEPR